MASRNQPLTSMNPLQHRDTTIKVRVVRLWFVPPYSSNMSKPNPGAVANQMVLCDSESGGNFRITTHSFKINFQFGTRVMPTVDDPKIHKYGFEWVTAESITSGNAYEKTLVVSLSCISELLYSADESVHCTIGSVLKVNTDKAWFYNACTKCKRKVEEDGESFYCNYCATPMSTAIPRFRLELVVIDDTALANFTLFYRDAASFLGVSVEFMKNKAEKVVATDQNGDTNIGSSFSQDVIAVVDSGESLTSNQEAEKITLNKESATPNNAMEGRSLSFSEEVTSEDRYTTISNKGNSYEESNTKRRVHDFNEVNIVSQDVLKKVKLEKL
ncbi:replication protein A 70 kDa DNA-binding subunit B-like [Senna tora]|uniref:Replication protein A 70 kDa DNA-binding subunit B-like n=1 Tax=Senna tora TaxID=362788 RepID=A0A834TSR1_9FABA|nr:replication protein A 70 kDa DNA-binding subunit B-like [Senna tora]